MTSNNYMVCFIDVLGTKDKVKTSPEEVIQSLTSVAKKIKNEIDRAKESEKYMYEIVLKTFSDNYLIAIPCKSKSKEYLKKVFHLLLMIVGRVTNVCIRDLKTLVRGAITFGKMYDDENIVIGKALVDAYILESNVSIYPRIAISDDVIDLVELSIDRFDKRNLTDKYFVDFDGVLCLNQLFYCGGKNYYTESLNAFLESSLKQYKTSKVGIKYQWFIRYIYDYYKQSGKKHKNLELLIDNYKI